MTFRCLLKPFGNIVGLGSTGIPVQLCFNSKSKVFESVSKSFAPASMKKPPFNYENMRHFNIMRASHSESLCHTCPLKKTSSMYAGWPYWPQVLTSSTGTEKLYGRVDGGLRWSLARALLKNSASCSKQFRYGLEKMQLYCYSS